MTPQPHRPSRPRFVLTALLMFLLLMLGSAPARAHKASDAYLRLSVDGTQVTQRLDVALRDLDRELHLDADDDGQLRWGEIRRREAELRSWLGREVRWTAEGGPACREAPSGDEDGLRIDTHSDGSYLVEQRRWHCDGPIRQLQVDYRLFALTDPLHRGLLRLQAGESSPRTAVLGPEHPRQSFRIDEATPPGSTDAWHFLRLGTLHILEGADHVLFLLTLLLPSVLVGTAAGWVPALRWTTVARRVAGIVTGFTLAHSLSLTAASLGWVQWPTRWIESAVAATVVLAALNNLWPVVREARARIGFAFGAVHGLAFAGALSDLGLQGWAMVPPLLAFNLGIELGQLLLLAGFLLLAWPLRAAAFYRVVLLRGGSAVVAVLGLGWLVERLLDQPVWMPALGS